MTHPVAASQRKQPAFSFTVATALAWLGHECNGGCPALAMATPASLWFIRRTSAGLAPWAEGVVVVDVKDDPVHEEQVRALVDEANRCAGNNQIRVRERVRTDQQRQSIPQPCGPLAADASLYLRALTPPESRAAGELT